VSKFIKKMPKIEIYLLGALLVITALLRFWNLGYSDFYGDETKTFYLDKTVTANEFFMNQRKGPLQFFVVWGMEKVLGGFDEFGTRLPFAVASFLSVVVFYYLVRRLFNWQVAVVATTLFSVSGFSVAFGRTVQYQSFLMFFGLLSACLFVEGFEVKGRLRNLYLGGVALSLVLAFYAHYDAVFFFLPILYMIIRGDLKKVWKPLLTYFLLPFSIFMSFFYVPYVFGGYLNSNVPGYIARRLSGSNFAVNHSLYTFFVYTPCVLFLGLLGLGMLVLFFRSRDERVMRTRDMILFWFLIPFVIFELIILNPGTHILNYFIPLYILVGFVVWQLMEGKAFKWQKHIVAGVIGIMLVLASVSSLRTYIPAFSSGYPWGGSEIKKYHLFLYGFPYNRGWNQIRSYFVEARAGGERIEGVFTNDNDTIGEYYLRDFQFTRPGSNFLPQYQILVKNNQEFSEVGAEYFQHYFLKAYEKKQDIYVDGELVAEIYKLRGGELPPNL
jgi:4-amino-4-deoxy-L-arabinose transferase-like glycosyltransferase